MPNADFDQIASTTLKEYSKTLQDNIFQELPFLYWLQEGGRIRPYNGGETIVEPLMYGKSTAVGSYSGYDTLNITPQTGISSAEFPLKQASASIVISGYQEVVNSGPNQVIDLLEAKMMQSKNTIADYMGNTLITSDGTGNSGKDWYGLELLIGGEFRSPDVGGIDASETANAYWRSVINDGGLAEAIDAMTTEPDPRALQISEMRTMFNDVSNGRTKPDLILTSQAQFEAYEAMLQPGQERFSAQMADAGFQNLLFKGVPVIYDDYVGDDDMWFLNSEFLSLRPFQPRWFTTTPFITPVNQDMKAAHIFMFGNLTVNNRRWQGLLSNLEVV